MADYSLDVRFHSLTPTPPVEPKLSVPDAVQAMQQAAHKAHVKDDEPFGILVQSLGNAMLSLDGKYDQLCAVVGSAFPINRVDVKIALLSVMTDAKSEFLRIVAKECTGMLLAGGAVVAAASFALGFLVASH